MRGGRGDPVDGEREQGGGGGEDSDGVDVTAEGREVQRREAPLRERERE